MLSGVRPSAVAALALVALRSLQACGGESAGSRAAPAHGSGGADAGVAGGTVATGGAPSTGGRSSAGGSPGTGGSPTLGAAGAWLTADEWAARIAPREGPHTVKVEGCEMTPIGAEYRVLPTIVCTLAGGYDPRTTPVRTCDVADYCTTDDQCSVQPHGVCTGFPTASCDYGLTSAACAADTDCTSLPGGSCVPGSSYGERFCYPTGECLGEQAPRCFYPETSCATDGDCRDRAGGVCRKIILYPRCLYHDCEVDTDCPGTNRCACHQCVVSSCTDDSCGPAQTCRVEYGCYTGPLAYHCSTPNDECASFDDCNGVPCEYQDGRFACRQTQCPTVP
jgi:hypothetical protein